MLKNVVYLALICIKTYEINTVKCSMITSQELTIIDIFAITNLDFFKHKPTFYGLSDNCEIFTSLMPLVLFIVVGWTLELG